MKKVLNTKVERNKVLYTTNLFLKAYNSGSKKCNLCLHEKILNICHAELGTLNSRNELISACRHCKKDLLANFSCIHVTGFNARRHS